MASGEHAPRGCILSLGGGPGGHGAVLVSEGASPVVGELDPILLTQAMEAVASVEAPIPGLLLPGHDLQLRRRERRGAEALWHLLSAGSLGPRLNQLCGIALAAREPLRIALDIGRAPLRNIPWELLGGLPSQTLGIDLEVVRCRPGNQVTSTPPPLDAPGVDVLLWTPNPSDPVCRQLGARLALGLGEWENLRLHTLSHLDGPLPETLGLTFLHIIAHGLGDVGGFVLSNGEDTSLAPDALQARCRRVLDRVHGVYLDVCSGGASGAGDVEDSPGWTLAINSGRTVIAPQRPLGTDAAEAFSKGIYGALSEGQSLSQGLQRGREMVSALGIAHSSCRWWTLSVVGGGDALDIAPSSGSGVDLGAWGCRDEGLLSFLQGAFALAEESGYLGVEHCLMALMGGAQGGHLPSTMKPFLLPLTERCLGYHRKPGAPIHLTPRLLAFQERVQAGLTFDEFLALIFEVDWVRGALPAGARQAMRPPEDKGDGATWTVDIGDLSALKEILGGGFSMVVEGGPEDGRVLNLTQVGQCIGRYSEGAEANSGNIALFPPPCPQDRGLSRKHVVYRGGSQVEILASVRLHRGGDERVLPKGQNQSLQLGDRLALGFGTHLRVTSL